MKIILTNQCASLTGCLNKGFGYSVQKQKGGFYSKRNSKGHVPPEGHLAFILACAKIANTGLYISDIRLSREELRDALVEAHKWNATGFLKKDFYTARDILNLKTLFGL